MTDGKPSGDHLTQSCGDCQGGPGLDNIRTVVVARTGCVVETWHLPDCPEHTVTRILQEDGARRADAQDLWARQALPAINARIQAAAQTVAVTGEGAEEFVAALAELAALTTQRQAERQGVVTPFEWVQVLKRHFPRRHSSGE